MLLIISYHYSIIRLARNRELYSLKCCYRPHLNFLKFRTSVVKTISNSIVDYSNNYNSFKCLNSFYISYLRDNFCYSAPLGKYYFKSNDVSFFIDNYKQYIGLKDLNRAFIWRALQLSPIFKAKLKLTRGRGRQVFNTMGIYFIKEEYRILMVWSWVRYLFQCFVARKYLQRLQFGMENFLGASESNNVVTSIKFQVYRVQLLRSL